MSKHSLEEYSKQSYRSHKEIKDLTLRNRTLESHASALIQKYEADRSNVLLTKKEEDETLRESLKDTQQALRVRSLELHRIKRLAKVIVQQRSELELFFTEALDYVRQEIQQERGRRNNDKLQLTGGKKYGRRASAKGGAPGEALGKGFQSILGQNEAGKLQSAGSLGNSLPPLSAQQDIPQEGGVSPYPQQSTLSNPSPQPSDTSRVDIGELSWADKERVLRILFAKISHVCSFLAKKKKCTVICVKSVNDLSISTPPLGAP